MSTDRSNSSPVVADHLARARALYEAGAGQYQKGDEAAAPYYRKGDEHHHAMVEEILAAKEVEPDLSDRAIARALRWPDHKRVAVYVEWHARGGDAPSPYAGRAPRRTAQAFRKRLREGDLEELCTEVLTERPDLVDALMDAEVDPGATASMIPPEIELHTLDAVVVDGDVIGVSDAADPRSKLRTIDLIGEAIMDGYLDPHAVGPDGKLSARIFADQPFDIGHEGIRNDERGSANWGPVYRLWNVKGGAIMYHGQPPYDDEARQGIDDAGYVRIANIVYYKAGGMKWLGGPRPPVPDSDYAGTMNVTDMITLFEAPGRQPWVVDRKALRAWLSAPAKTARLRRILAGGKYPDDRGAHPHPKDPDVISRVIAMMSEPGDIIVDMFCGSGTTWCAAIMTGRRFVGVELDPHFASRAVVNAVRFHAARRLEAAGQLEAAAAIRVSLDVQAVVDAAREAGVVATVYQASSFHGSPFDFGTPRPPEPDWGD